MLAQPPAACATVTAPCLQAEYEIRLSYEEDGEDLEYIVVTDSAEFTPTTGHGWGDTQIDDPIDEQPMTWATLWGTASPYCRAGAVKGVLMLSPF